jgi:phosphatidylethanolamine/phosphatidyl-N-methylethanolamine N-methyltransferase
VIQFFRGFISLKERALFFARWVLNPRQLGAISPSSRALAKLIGGAAVAEHREKLEQGHYILELGAGTGVFTKALLRAGVSPAQLICIELDHSLHGLLAQKFPGVHLIKGDARVLKQILPQDSEGRIIGVVSGIPFMTLPQAARAQIIGSIFDVLAPGGSLYQFTYSPFSSISTGQFDLRKKRVGTVFQNFPPATVWAYHRRGEVA